MKPSTLLRTFSSKLSCRLSSSSVAPWPPVRTAFDRWLTSELEHLRACSNLYATAAWLSNLMDVAISAQRTAVDTVSSSKAATNVFDSYLECTVELLDACNVVRKRIEDVRAYTESVAIAVHYLEGQEPGNAAVCRARAALDSCSVIEKKCSESDTCRPSFALKQESELDEILSGSKALALLVIGMSNTALSFRTRRGVPTIQSSKNGIFDMQKEVKEEFEKRRKDGGVVLEELKATVSTVQRVRSLICRGECRGELRGVVRELRMKSEELDQGIRVLEGRVDGLYKGLIDLRLCLLGVISQA